MREPPASREPVVDGREVNRSLADDGERASNACGWMTVQRLATQQSARPHRIALLYEWLIFNTSYTGICLSRPRAMSALMLTLFDLGDGSGLVRPVELVDTGCEWRYERSFYPLWHATGSKGIVQWQ